MVDVTTPTKPTFAGCYAEEKTGRSGTGYVHDALCINYNGPDAQYKGKEICFNSAETALSIADATDKKAPKTISIANYPSASYTHQGGSPRTCGTSSSTTSSMTARTASPRPGRSS